MKIQEPRSANIDGYKEKDCKYMYCKKAFKPRSSNDSYCSDACKQKQQKINIACSNIRCGYIVLKELLREDNRETAVAILEAVDNAGK